MKAQKLLVTNLLGFLFPLLALCQDNLNCKVLPTLIVMLH